MSLIQRNIIENSNQLTINNMKTIEGKYGYTNKISFSKKEEKA